MTITSQAVQKSITVEAPQARAFEVFTSRMADWWPRTSHHLSDAAEASPVLEPREGGRWYEVDQDGKECDWGYVIAWDPPARVVLAWQLNAEFAYDRDFVTEVEVRFVAEGASRTRVELEHRDLERYGDKRDRAASALDGDGGWSQLLGFFAEGIAA